MFFKMTELRSALSEIQTLGLESLSTETQKSENFKYSVKTLTLCQTQTVSFNIVFLPFFIFFLCIYFLVYIFYSIEYEVFCLCFEILILTPTYYSSFHTTDDVTVYCICIIATTHPCNAHARSV